MLYSRCNSAQFDYVPTFFVIVNSTTILYCCLYHFVSKKKKKGKKGKSVDVFSVCLVPGGLGSKRSSSLWELSELSCAERAGPWCAAPEEQIKSPFKESASPWRVFLRAPPPLRDSDSHRAGGCPEWDLCAGQTFLEHPPCLRHCPGL